MQVVALDGELDQAEPVPAAGREGVAQRREHALRPERREPGIRAQGDVRRLASAMKRSRDVRRSGACEAARASGAATAPTPGAGRWEFQLTGTTAGHVESAEKLSATAAFGCVFRHAHPTNRGGAV
jgi:hypothetical protein